MWLGRCDSLAPRDMNEVCVPSQGTWIILGQFLRCKDRVPKTVALSLSLTATLLFQQVELLLASMGGQKVHWTGATAHDPR